MSTATEPIAPHARIAEFVRQRPPNPFNNQRPTTDPARFVGRSPVVQRAVASVASGRNVVITGPYGYGKTSVDYQMVLALSGNEEVIAKHDLRHLLPPVPLAIARHKCQADNDLPAVLAGLISSLRTSYGDAGLRKPVQELWDAAKRAGKGWLTKTVTVEPRRDPEGAVGERASQNKFYRYVMEFLAREKTLARLGLGGVGGIVFIIDEVEVLAITVKIGSLVKAAIEFFAEHGITWVCFVISGAEDTAARMYAQVNSARRVFDQIVLPGMTGAELRAILTTSLAGTGVAIDDDIADLIVRLASPSPARLHYLAWAIYEQAVAGRMNRQAFEAAADDILGNIERSDFRRVIQLPTWDCYRRILECIASRGDAGVTAEQIGHDTGLPSASLGGYLKTLMHENILRLQIEVDGKKQYAFAEPVFGLYFNLANELGVQLPHVT